MHVVTLTGTATDTAVTVAFSDEIDALPTFSSAFLILLNNGGDASPTAWAITGATTIEITCSPLDTGTLNINFGPTMPPVYGKRGGRLQLEQIIGGVAI